MAQIEVVFHLPGVFLEGDEKYPLGDGHVEALSFEQWQQLDEGAFSFADTKFRRSRPAFWCGNVTIEQVTLEDAFAAACQMRHNVHSAFLLEPHRPWIPTPALSVMYYRIPLNDGIVQSIRRRSIGPMEREWIVYGSDLKIVYDAGMMADVDRLFKWLEKFHPLSLYKSALAGLAVLERTARPESWWGDCYQYSINNFLHCVAACEDLMIDLPHQTKGKGPKGPSNGDVFAKHAATLTTQVHSEIKELKKTWESIYALRNQLMHGRIGIQSLNDASKRLLPMTRYLLGEIIMAVLALQLRDGDEPTLPRLLAQAFDNPSAHATLHQRLQENRP